MGQVYADRGSGDGLLSGHAVDVAVGRVVEGRHHDRPVGDGEVDVFG